MNPIQYFILFGAVFLGGSLAFRFQSGNKFVLQLVLSFCGAYLLGLIALHLLPDVFHEGEQTIGLWLLGGFFIQILLERLSLGVEHGHIHDHHHGSKLAFAVQVLVGLSIHAFIEGLPLSMPEAFHEGHAHHHHESLYFGVIMHKAPEAFALALLLLMSHFSKKMVWGFLFVFSLMSPLGAFMTQVIDINAHTYKIILAIVVGSLLHISTTIIFETDNSDEHHITFSKIAAILTGVGLSLLTLL